MLFGTPLWMIDYSLPWYVCAALYPLYHANIAHLAANCISIRYLFAPRRLANKSVLLVSYAISFLVYPLSQTPVLGISNLLFAAIGLRTPAFSDSWWRSTNSIIFLAITVGMLFIPCYAGITHIVSFAIGVLIAAISRKFKPILDDVKRYCNY